jgi:hypothetical protein
VRIVIVGAGAVGARAARQLFAITDVDDLALVDVDPARAEAAAAAFGPPARAAGDDPGIAEGDVVLLAMPSGHQRWAARAIDQRAHVVSAADSIAEVSALLELDEAARSRGVHVVVGAGFSPGLSCVLASLAGRSFERVDEIHVAKTGTGGPACARQHHRALAGQTFDWRDGAWQRRSAGSGRELCWFPDPVRARDCYRAATPEPLLLVPAFEGVTRVTARMSANRRDRLSAGLPMLRRPHPEGDLGAVRVEVRGVQGTAREERVLGAVDRPAVAAGAVSALACLWAASGRLSRTGAAGLASLVDPGPFLSTLAERGVKGAVFEGGRHTVGATTA